MCKKIKVDHQLTLYMRINLKWIRDLNLSCETIKILEENTGDNISDISHSNIFANIFPWLRERKEKINKWDYIKLKNFLHSKRNHSQNDKGTHCMEEHICQSYI